MKITCTAALALIAVILGSTNSQLSGSPLQSACIRSGVPNAWENLQIYHSNVNAATESVRNALQAGLRGSSFGIDLGLRQYCTKIETLKESIRNFMGSLNPCLEPDQRPLASQHMDAAIASIDYPCENRFILTVATATTNSQCVSSKVDGMFDCGREMLVGSKASVLESLIPSFNSQPRCSIHKYAQCLLSAFEACGPQLLLSNIVTPLLNSLGSTMHCTNLAQSGGSQGLPGLTNLLSPFRGILPGLF